MKTTRLIGTRCKHGDMFSQCVLIGRGLDHIFKEDGSAFAKSRRELVFSFEGTARYFQKRKERVCAKGEEPRADIRSAREGRK